MILNKFVQRKSKCPRSFNMILLYQSVRFITMLKFSILQYWQTFYTSNGLSHIRITLCIEKKVPEFHHWMGLFAF